MDTINRVIDWCFTAWFTFTDWLNTKPMPDIHRATVVTWWIGVACVLLCVLLGVLYVWIEKITKPFYAACLEREQEHAEGLKQVQKTCNLLRSGNDLG